MVEISRRLFLGGAISLIGVKTFAPSVSIAAMSNMPTIYADGVHSDVAGLGALFRNEPVIFPKDKIAVESQEGVIFHKGVFVVDQTIYLPRNSKITFEKNAPLIFLGENLTDHQPFFMCEAASDMQQFSNYATFEVKPGQVGQLLATSEHLYGEDWSATRHRRRL